MPWPKECERYVDWSFYQNHGWPLYKPFDIDAFCAAHPEVDGAVLRFCWPNGSVDQNYTHNYDGFVRNGKRVMGYGWPNPQKHVSFVMEDWKKALGERIPKVIFKDWEEASTFVGKTNGQLTDCMKATEFAAKVAFPDSVHGNYSRAAWIDKRIIVGDWFHTLIWWLAHWIYPPPDFKNQATSFSELDALLPIDNNFTPYRGKSIRKDNVIGWQLSSKGLIVPRGTSDMDYFLLDFTDPIFNGGTPPPPPPEKTEIEVKYNPDDAVIKLTET